MIGRVATKLLTERFAFDGGTVGGTTEAPVIEGVLLCGATSSNRRRYSKKAFEGDRVKRYDGAPVNLNHGRGPDGRPYQEQIGIIQNSRHRTDGLPIGDIAVNPKKPYAEAFLWDAKHQPKACGMSHVAHCDTTLAADGWEDVTELVRVESVDVISAGNAATTKGLYESGGRTVATTFGKLLESVLPKLPPERAKPLRKWLVLAEDDAGMSSMLDTPVAEPAADTGHEEAIANAFEEAGAAVWKDFCGGKLDMAGMISKLKEIAKAHGKISGGGESDKDGDGDPDPPKESKKPTLRDVIKECTAASYAPTTDELAVLVEITDPETRKGYVSTLRAKVPGEQPRGAARKPGSTVAGTTTTAPVTGQGNGKKTESRTIPAWDAE